mmetsp:Transcript_11502/g.25453  ORF Transcript_11502/g.25453 Transcript_11502/m.25453 type:complete len:662 (-) Transcript_11502:187-2172(-)
MDGPAPPDGASPRLRISTVASAAAAVKSAVGLISWRGKATLVKDLGPPKPMTSVAPTTGDDVSAAEAVARAAASPSTEVSSRLHWGTPSESINQDVSPAQPFIGRPRLPLMGQLEEDEADPAPSPPIPDVPGQVQGSSEQAHVPEKGRGQAACSAQSEGVPPPAASEGSTGQTRLGPAGAAQAGVAQAGGADVAEGVENVTPAACGSAESSGAAGVPAATGSDSRPEDDAAGGADVAAEVGAGDVTHAAADAAAGSAAVHSTAAASDPPEEEAADAGADGRVHGDEPQTNKRNYLAASVKSRAEAITSHYMNTTRAIAARLRPRAFADEDPWDSMEVVPDNDNQGDEVPRQLQKGLRVSVRQKASRFFDPTATMPVPGALVARDPEGGSRAMCAAGDAEAQDELKSTTWLARMPPETLVMLCSFLCAAAPLPAMTCRAVRQRFTEQIAQQAFFRLFQSIPDIDFQSWYTGLAMTEFCTRRGDLEIMDILVSTIEELRMLVEAIGGPGRSRILRQVSGHGWVVPVGAELPCPAFRLETMQNQQPFRPFRMHLKVREHILTAAAAHSARVMHILLGSRTWYDAHLIGGLVAAVHHRQVACVGMLLDAKADPDVSVRYRKQMVTARQVSSSPDYQCAAISALLRQGDQERIAPSSYSRHALSPW